MFKATAAINAALKKSENLKVFVDEDDGQSSVWVQFKADNGPSYRIRFISTDDDNDVAVRVFSLIKVTDDKRDKVVKALNAMNVRFRYAKFVVDDDGDINVEYDFPVRASNVENCAEEIIIRFVRIIDEAYSEIMRAMWS